MSLSLRIMIMAVAVIGLSCSSSTDPVEGPSTYVYLSVANTTSTAYSVHRWNWQMSSPELLVDNAWLTAPPMGDQMAMVRINGTNYEVLTANTDGSDVQTAVSVTQRIYQAAISKSGRYLAYTQLNTESGNYRIVLIDQQTEETKVVALEMAPENRLYWSPSADRFAYVGKGDDFETPDTLVVLDAATGVRTATTTNMVAFTDWPDYFWWSHDGSKILYLQETEEAQIPIVFDPATQMESPFPMPQNELFIAGDWNSNNADIFAATAEFDKFPVLDIELGRINSEGQLTRLKNFGSTGSPYNISASSDGTSLAYGFIPAADAINPNSNLLELFGYDLENNREMSLGVSGSKPYFAK